ncbi:MAG TPA: isoprenylcysteine carboxylmethyltransferase family protein [Bryobacteraceae bacterium]|jgi:protein-S-isoprenylcysteine O-methyltransferase Ste14|nr:isoprenylcysteine carboxylmethyltransferase family protein [Bryobacteraceae bacterium]
MPLVFSWPYGLIFLAAMFWAFAPEFRIISRQTEPLTSAQDAGSKRVIAIGQGLAMLAAFAIAASVPAGRLAHPFALFWAGLATTVAGSLLRRHCWRMLGASFTGAVIVRPDQAVVDRGAYHYVRHPSYTAGAILFLGIGLALGNWIGLVVLMGAVLAVYGYRVGVEERALLGTIGEPYRSYMRRTKRFVPFVL